MSPCGGQGPHGGNLFLHAPLRANEEDLRIRLPVPDGLSDCNGGHDVASGPSGCDEDPHIRAPRDTESTIPEVIRTVSNRKRQFTGNIFIVGQNRVTISSRSMIKKTWIPKTANRLR